MKNSVRVPALALVCILAMLVIPAGCRCKADVWTPGQPLEKEKLVIGVMYISDPFTENSGYSFAHEEGIKIMQEQLGLREEQIQRRINIFDTDPALTETTMRELISGGAQLIIATSYRYMDTCEKIASEFPNVIIAHCSGHKSNSTNFTNYFGRMYQAKYLAGIAAGLRTKTGKIGYVDAYGKDNSECAGLLNAFAIGAESANPAARVLVKATGSWFDPVGETDAARALIEAGCDVISQGCDSPAPQTTAELAGLWGIGYNSDMRDAAPDAVMTSAVWHWDKYYIELVQSVLGGSFTPAPYFGGLDSGVVNITELVTDLCAPGTAEKVEAARQRIIGEGFNVFDGVLETNDGKTVGSPGGTLPDEDIVQNIKWYYRNIDEP